MNPVHPLNSEQPIQLVPARRAFVPRGMAQKAEIITEKALESICDPVKPTLNIVREQTPNLMENGFMVAGAILDQSVAEKYPQIPEHVRHVAIGISAQTGSAIAANVAYVTLDKLEDCADKTKESTQNIANQVIHSNRCYGDEDSCVSRITTRFFGN